eukprot:scaffold104630_cov21-Phaeocystis_antarctica.AAC.1
MGRGGGASAAAAVTSPLPRWHLAAWLILQPLPPPPRLHCDGAAVAREARETEEGGRVSSGL